MPQRTPSSDACMEHVITARPGETYQALEERLATISDVYSAASVLPPKEDAPPIVVGPAAQDLGPGDSPIWPSAKHMGVGLFPALQRFP